MANVTYKNKKEGERYNKIETGEILIIQKVEKNELILLFQIT